MQAYRRLPSSSSSWILDIFVKFIELLVEIVSLDSHIESVGNLLIAINIVHPKDFSKGENSSNLF